MCPVSPSRDVNPEKYAQLLDAVNLLRDVPKYRPTPAGWQLLKPILVNRFEEVSGRFSTAENKYMRSVACRAVRPTKSGMARSPSSTSKSQRKNSVKSKHREPSVAVQDLHMSVTGDDSGSIDMRGEGKQTEMHAETTVTTENTGLSVDDLRKTHSAAVEDDAASDVTIITSDIDNDEFRKLSVDDAQQKASQDASEEVMNVDNAEDELTTSVQQPLSDDDLSITVTSDVRVEQKCSETENMTHYGPDVSVEQKYSETDTMVNDTADHVMYGDFIHVKDAVPECLQITDKVESMKDEVACTVEDNSELFHMFESQSDVIKTLENITETARVTDEYTFESDVTDVNETSENIAKTTNDEYSLELDALLSGKDYPESETAENECVTSLNLPSAETIDVTDSDEMQNIRDSINAVDVSANVSATSYIGTEEEDVTSDKVGDAVRSDVELPITSDSTASALSDFMESLDLRHSSHLVAEDAAAMNRVQSAPESTQTSSVSPTHESPQTLSMETGLACVDDITEPALGDASRTDAARMLTTEDVGGKTSAECLDGETGDSVVADSTSRSETSVSSHIQDAVVEKRMPSITGGNSSAYQRIRLSGDVADVIFSRCSVSLYRIPVSDASHNTVDVVPSNANECIKLQRRCSVVLERLPSLESSTQSLSSALAPTGPCTKADDDDDDDVSIITISDDDDKPVLLVKNSVPQTLGIDDQCHNMPEITSNIHESVQEVMSTIDVEENEGNHMERQPSDVSKAASEAECCSSQDQTSANVNSSAIPDADDQLYSSVSVAERQHSKRSPLAERLVVTDETINSEDVSTGHLEHGADEEEEISMDVAVPTACSESESSRAVNENLLYTKSLPDNSERTDMPSDPLEPADLVSWRPTQALLSLAAEMISERDASKEPPKESEEVDVSMSRTLNKVDLLAATGLTEEEAVTVTEDSRSCAVIECDAVEAAGRDLSPIASIDVNLSPSFRPNNDSKVTAGEDVGGLTELATVPLTDCNLTALVSANIDSSAALGFTQDKENTVIGTAFRGIAEAAVVAETGSSLSALASHGQKQSVTSDRLRQELSLIHI